MSRKVTGKTKMLGVLGTPVEHSSSPEIHNAAFRALGLDYEYLAFDVKPEQLEKAVEGMRALGAVGFSVTMPYKQTVVKYMDELSTEARLCGAVNCVVNRDGKLIGYNTDGYGMVHTLRNYGVGVDGTKMTIIGTGGVSSAICTQAALDGVKEIALFGIKDATFKMGENLAQKLTEETNCKVSVYELEDKELFRKHVKESQILCNATPVGMGKLEGKSPVDDRSIFRSDLAVMDVIYNPKKTRFLEMAEMQGCKIMNGRGMLFFQGAKSFKLWTGKEMPAELIQSAIGE